MTTLWIIVVNLCLFQNINPIGSVIKSSKEIRPKPPNIVFILTDDQDDVLGSTDYMPNLQNLIFKKGVRFVNNFVTTPVCCPSRSAILSGRFAHNNLAKNNSISGNCSSISWQAREGPKALPKILHDNGYQTFFAGKYLNQFGKSGTGGMSRVPPGWDWFAAWIQQTKRQYYNYVMSVNGTREYHGNHPRDYFTNVLKTKALEFLRFTSPRQPFFMMICPTAPHAPFTPLPKYDKNFTDLLAPRTPSFNHHSDDKHWIVKVKPQHLSDRWITKIDQDYRDRLRTLQSVDSMLQILITKLQSTGQIGNTVFIFSSDNGFHLGQFCMLPEKRMNYEFDIKVPLAVAGRGILQNQIRSEIVQSIDITATILDIAEIPPLLNWHDGQSFLPLLTGSNLASQNSSKFPETLSIDWKKFALIEYRGEGNCKPPKSQGGSCENPPGCLCNDNYNNSYNCIRHLTAAINEVYCEFLDDVSFREYYDLSSDPWQLTNQIQLLPAGRLYQFHVQLDAMTRCRGDTCRSLSQDWAIKEYKYIDFK